jgi:hypothetical protein
MRPISSRAISNTGNRLLMMLLLQTILLVGLALLTQTAAAAERRVALLIGNATYQHEKRLSNPVNDAELLGGVLKDTLKFDDVRIERNLNVHAMDKVVEDFAQRAKGADSVVFYYSGHGIKSPDRRSFLLPIDARTGTGDAPALDRQAVSAEAIRDKLKAAGARVTLLILDACRDGPGGGKSGNKGLARIGGNSSGLLVAYATEEDQVAQDGKGRNSPYAEALAQALKRTDLPILEQLDWVADEVHRKEPSQQPTRDGNLRAKAYLVNPSVGQGMVAATQIASIKPEPVAPAPRPVPVATLPVMAPSVATTQSVQASDLIDGRYQILAGGAEVKDTKTRLIWQRCSVGQNWDGMTCSGRAVSRLFTEATDIVKNENVARMAAPLTAWRLPTFDELVSLRKCDKDVGGVQVWTGGKLDLPAAKGKTMCHDEKWTLPKINNTVFVSTADYLYWTSTKLADAGNEPPRYWWVNFYNGATGHYQANSSGHFRLVRSD